MRKLAAVILILFAWNVWYARSHVSFEPGVDCHQNDNELSQRTVFADKTEIVVDLVDKLPISEIHSLESVIGEKLMVIEQDSFDTNRLMVIHLSDPTHKEKVLDLLKHDNRVESAEPNYVFSIPTPVSYREEETKSSPIQTVLQQGEPNDPLFRYQWHMRMVHAPEAWNLTKGEGVVVAVIDTGVTHTGKVVEDLRGAEFVHPYNFIDKTQNANDDHGHGTHVAGTIAQVTNNGLGCAGVAPKAKIMPLKVLSKYGSGTVADIAAAIIYAADKGANVINMSLGGPIATQILERAVDYAHSKGVVVVCAAGNSSGSVGYPAGYKNAVSVSSVGFDGVLTWYSSWGKVEIAAPGGDLRASKNGSGKPDGVLQNTISPRNPENMALYEMFQGTSMASPHVAGVAALVISGLEEKTTADEVLHIMQMSANKKDNPKQYGAGIVDALAAVQTAKSWQQIKFFEHVPRLFGAPLVH